MSFKIKVFRIFFNFKLIFKKITSLDNRIYSYTIIYSYIVNVNLILTCTEISELIIYCKYAWKFLVFWSNILYLLFLLNIWKTYERYTKSSNLGFCYQPISMPNNIARQYQRHIKNPVELLRWSSFTKSVNG